MSTYTIMVILGILLAALLVFNFLGFFKDFIPSQFREKKIFKIISIATLGLVGLIAGTYILYSSGWVIPFSSKSLSADKPYYQNPDYWHPFINYRNNQVTKIYNPLSETSFLAFYREWESIEEVGFSVKETPNGFEPIKKEWEYIIRNDSLLSLKASFPRGALNYKFGPQNYDYHFKENGKLDKIKGPKSITYEYSYDSTGRISEFTTYSGSQLIARQSVEYSNSYDYKVSFINAESHRYAEEYWKHNLWGYPTSSLFKEYHPQKNFDIFGRELKEEIVFSETEKIDIEYEKEKSTTRVKYILKGQEKISTKGKGLVALLDKMSDDKGEFPEINERKYCYDDFDNWYVKLYLKNDLVYQIGLRKITYKDGSYTGSIDPKLLNSLECFEK